MWSGCRDFCGELSEGWDSLVAFAQQREAQNSCHIDNSNSKQKGRRELEGLKSIINFYKGRIESERRVIWGAKRS